MNRSLRVSYVVNFKIKNTRNLHVIVLRVYVGQTKANTIFTQDKIKILNKKTMDIDGAHRIISNSTKLTSTEKKTTTLFVTHAYMHNL